MVWPAQLLNAPPLAQLPRGYALRTYRSGDAPRFYTLMALAGWPGWDDEKLRPWQARVPPASWFLAVHEGSGEVVATAMTLTSEVYHDGAELGWVACDPAHTGQGLGMVVCAAVTAWSIAAGYRHIHLWTEHYRLPALKTYLKLGYVPFLSTADMPERWRAICAQLSWPFTPQIWAETAKTY
jgi:mycothiol synthase